MPPQASLIKHLKILDKIKGINLKRIVNIPFIKQYL